MTICPIAWAVHCVGCPLVKICPAKTLLGDFDTYKADNAEDLESDNTETNSGTDDRDID